MTLYDESAHILASITLDAWDLPSPVIRIEHVRSVYSGWFGFGRHLGYKALVEYNGMWAQSECCPTPQTAVRNAIEALRDELAPFRP